MGSLFWKYNFAYVYVPNVESGGRVSCLLWSLPAFSCTAQSGRVVRFAHGRHSAALARVVDAQSQQAMVPSLSEGNAMFVLQLWMDMFDHIMVGLFFFQIIMTGGYT